jgi:hypothetical protein
MVEHAGDAAGFGRRVSVHAPVPTDYYQSQPGRNPVGDHLSHESDFEATQCRYRSVAPGRDRRYGQRNATARLASAGILPLSVVN